MEDKEKIINAIRVATNGTFIGHGGMSTLMGWFDEYDEQGRLVTCDPNYKDSTVTIDGTTYKITKHGWNVYIWKPEYKDTCGYTTCWANNYQEYLFAELNIMPDYVKEYKEKKRLEHDNNNKR